MPDRGATYTIVVDHKKEIVSITRNGELMGKEGEPSIPVFGREGNQCHGIPVPQDIPHGFSGCICLGGPPPDIAGGTHLWKYSKVY